MTAFFVEATNNISFVSGDTETHNQNIDSNNEILFLSSVKTNHILKSINNILNLTGEFTTNFVISKSASSTLNLIQETVKASPIHVSASNTLPLISSDSENIKNGESNSELNLEQLMFCAEPKLVSAFNNITNPVEADLGLNPDLFPDPIPDSLGFGLRQEVSLQVILNPSASTLISWGQKSAPTQVGTANSHIHLSQEALKVLYDDPEDIIYFQQSASSTVSTPLTNTLTFEQTLSSNGVVARELTSTLILKSIATFHFVQFCEFDLGVGDGECLVPAPSPTPPVLLRRESTIFTYPYSTPTDTFELRNPQFDNVEQFEFRRISRRSRGGELQIYRDENWPKAERLIVSFNAMKEDTARQLLNFMNKSLGKEIGILDFESRQWRGILLTPSAQVEEGNTVGFSTSLEFEGVQV